MVFAARRRDWNKQHPWMGPAQELGKEALQKTDVIQRREVVKAYKDMVSRIDSRRQELDKSKAQQTKLARKEQSELPQWIRHR